MEKKFVFTSDCDGVEKFNELFKDGDIVTSRFYYNGNDNAKCIFKLKCLQKNEFNDYIALAYYGVNADNELKYDTTFGLESNELYHSTEDEIKFLNSCSATDEDNNEKPNQYDYIRLGAVVDYEDPFKKENGIVITGIQTNDGTINGQTIITCRNECIQACAKFFKEHKEPNKVKKAFLVSFLPTTRVVCEVPEDFDGENNQNVRYGIIQKAIGQMQMDISNYLNCDNLEQLEEDYECPYNEGIDEA